MSRKHYRAIADVLAAEYVLYGSDPDVEIVLRNVMLSLADICKQDNPRFDRERFYNACGIPQYLPMREVVR